MGPRSSASGGVRDIIAASVERTWTAEREAEKPEKPDESARPAVAAASIVPCDEEIGVQIKRHAPTRNLSTSSGSALENPRSGSCASISTETHCMHMEFGQPLYRSRRSPARRVAGSAHQRAQHAMLSPLPCPNESPKSTRTHARTHDE